MNDERLFELQRRLERIEEERAIERVIASYGPLVDAGEAEAAADLWATDGSYDVEGWPMRSREDVAAMVRSDAHQGLIGRGCTHFLGPAVVTVDGDGGGGGVRVGPAGPPRGRLRRRAGGRQSLPAQTASTIDGRSWNGRRERLDGIARRVTCWLGVAGS